MPEVTVLAALKYGGGGCIKSCSHIASSSILEALCHPDQGGPRKSPEGEVLSSPTWYRYLGHMEVEIRTVYW
jgi:hypothetical protein